MKVLDTTFEKHSKNEINEKIEKIKILQLKGHYEEALTLLNESISKISKENSSLKIELFLLRADIMSENNNSEEAAKNYRKALIESEATQNYEGIYESLEGLADILNHNTINNPSLTPIAQPKKRIEVAELPANLSLCPECGGYVVVCPTRNDYVCYNCGLIIWRRQIQDSGIHEKRGDFATHMGYYGNYSDINSDNEFKKKAIFRQKQMNEFMINGRNAFDGIRNELYQNMMQITSQRLNLKKNVSETAHAFIYNDRKLLQNFKIVNIVAAAIIKSSNQFSYKLDIDLLKEILESEDDFPDNEIVEKIISLMKT